MKFLVDAQLPRMIARELNEAGHDAVHTLNLPDGNRTTDRQIIQLSLSEARVVITKDADFVNSFHLTGQPTRLLLISTGNISNAELRTILISNIEAIERAFSAGHFVELSRFALTTHV